MSKKDIDFNMLGTAKTMDKEGAGMDTEKAVALIHDKLPVTEKTKRITIDLPFSLYVDIKSKIVSQEMTMKGLFHWISQKRFK